MTTRRASGFRTRARLLVAMALALAAPAAAEAVGIPPVGVSRCGAGSAILRWTVKFPSLSPGRFRLYAGGEDLTLRLLTEIPLRADEMTYRQPLLGAGVDFAVFQLRFLDDQGDELVLGTLICGGQAFDGLAHLRTVGPSSQADLVSRPGSAVPAASAPRRAMAARAEHLWSAEVPTPPPEFT
jgi:hypothetical protein